VSSLSITWPSPLQAQSEPPDSLSGVDSSFMLAFLRLPHFSLYHCPTSHCYVAHRFDVAIVSFLWQISHPIGIEDNGRLLD
jgi:hypothetical protein